MNQQNSKQSHHHIGMSLLELLVSISIIAACAALVLCAITAARTSAFRISNNNKIRNLSLATLQINDTDNKLPKQPAMIYQRIAKHLDLQPARNNQSIQYFPYYLDDTDPSVSYYPTDQARMGNCSFAFNSYILNTNFVAQTSDGLSNTLLFSERYARCHLNDTMSDQFYEQCYSNSKPTKQIPCGCNYRTRAATFSDSNYCDFNSKTWDIRATPFQVLPIPERCETRLLQSLTRAGLAVGFGDGSVKTISPLISSPIFWALTTPNGGEPAGTID